MAKLPDVTQEAGLDPLVCGNCGRKIRTGQLVRRMFATILCRLTNGQTVKVHGFGTFKPGVHKPRGFAADREPSKIVRFTLTPGAKRTLNRGEENG